MKINKSVTETNENIAASIRKHLNKIISVNIMGAPGAGKTTLIEGIAKHIDPKQIAVIQGDLESNIDKIRMEKAGIQTIQINTHSGCHLNADMVLKAIQRLDLSAIRFLLIENVGNLVCPAGIDLGEDLKIVVSATTEGSDKPKKYPVIFHDTDAVVISKYDLAEIVGFDEKKYTDDVSKITRAQIFRTARDSFKEFAQFLDNLGSNIKNNIKAKQDTKH